MSPVDHALRTIAGLTAVAALAVVAANPQFHSDSRADALSPVAANALQREAAGKTKGFSFLLKSPDSRYPGRWCGGTIDYTLDLSQVSGAGMDEGEEAARWARVWQRWAEASRGHYQFRYAGLRSLTTREDGQLDLDGISPGTISITYVHDDAGEGDPGYQAAAVRGRTAGNGGLQVVSNGAAPGGSLVGDRGFVMIDAEDAAALSPDGLRESLYQHESGHALGLGHVASDTSIMNGTLSSERQGLAPGDLSGIRALTAMPCQR